MTNPEDFETRLQKEQEKLHHRYKGSPQTKLGRKSRLMTLIGLLILVIGVIWIYSRSSRQSYDEPMESLVSALAERGVGLPLDNEEKSDSTSSLQRATGVPPEGMVEIQETKLSPQTHLDEEKAYAAFMKGDYKGALKQYEQLNATYPDYLPFLTNLAFLYERLEQWTKAEIIYKNMVLKDADNLIAQFGLVRVQSHLSPKLALETLKNLRHKNPRNGFLLKMEAKLYFDMGMVPAAIMCLEELTHSNPDDLRALYNLALLYKKKGDVKKAQSLWQSIDQSLAKGSKDPFLKQQVNYQLRHIDRAQVVFSA